MQRGGLNKRLRAINEYSRTIRIPVGQADRSRKIKATIKCFDLDINNPNDFKKLAECLNVSEEKLKKIMLEEISVVSFDEVIEGTDNTLYNTVFDKNNDVSKEVINKNVNNNLLDEVKKILTEEEYFVLSKQLGLEDDKIITLEEIGKKLAISKSNAYRIKARALFKLRNNTNIRNLFYAENARVYKKPEIKENVFDIHRIHPNMTFDILLNLLKLFPEKEQKVYMNYRRISLNHHCILPAKQKNYSKNFIVYMGGIERDLKIMFEYLDKINKTRKNESEILLELKKYMMEHSIRFCYLSSKKEKLKEDLDEIKIILNDKKVQNFMASLYEKYFSLYGSFITEEKLENLIRNTIDSYFNLDESESLVLYCNSKLEKEIILNLIAIYKSNPNDEKSLEIPVLLEEIFRNKIKEKSIDEISDLSLAVKKSLLEYTGNRSFRTEISLNLKRLTK